MLQRTILLIHSLLLLLLLLLFPFLLLQCCFNRGAASSYQTICWISASHLIFDASFFASFPFSRTISILVDKENVRLDNVQVGLPVQHAHSRAHDSPFYVANCLHHVQSLLFWKHCVVMFQRHDILVRTDRHIEITMLRCVCKECDVSRVEEIVAARDHDDGT